MESEENKERTDIGNHDEEEEEDLTVAKWLNPLNDYDTDTFKSDTEPDLEDTDDEENNDFDNMAKKSINNEVEMEYKPNYTKVCKKHKVDFNGTKNLKSHKGTKHKKLRWEECEDCKKYTNLKETLGKHMEIHKGDKKAFLKVCFEQTLKAVWTETA